MFLVDWVNGARDLYGLSVQNTRVVGRVIGKTIQFLNTETGAQFDRMHLIGHSLGAHISGYAGAFQPGIARISGRKKFLSFIESNQPVSLNTLQTE